MNWYSVEGLSSLMRFMTWFIAVGTLVAGIATVLVIIADKKRERLQRDQDLVNERKVEDLRERNTELEKSLAPRAFPSIKADIKDKQKWREEFDALKATLDGLKNTSGINAAIEVVPDFEARKAARVIESIVVQAGWNHTFTVVDNEGIRDGVVIWRHLSNDLAGSISPGTQASQDEAKSQNAAESLAACLKYFGWQADIEMGSRAESPLRVPPNTVRIQVGLKPSPFFEPDWVKKIRKMADEANAKSKNQ